MALDGITIEHASVASPPAGGARALVDLDGGSVVLAGGAGRGAFVYVGVEIRPGATSSSASLFPVLVANAVHALAGASDVATADVVARSEIALRAAAPTDAAEEPEVRSRVPLRPPSSSPSSAPRSSPWRRGAGGKGGPYEAPRVPSAASPSS